MFARIASALLVMSLVAAQSHGRAEVFEDVTYCQLAKNPAAYAGKRIRIRAIYTYMFEASRLRPTECCAEKGPPIWVDFDEERYESLAHQIPEGMGTVLGIFRGKIETGRKYGPSGESTRLVIDRIEKVEKKVGGGKQVPGWVPKDCPE